MKILAAHEYRITVSIESLNVKFRSTCGGNMEGNGSSSEEVCIEVGTEPSAEALMAKLLE
jgi:hypothetical protein